MLLLHIICFALAISGSYSLSQTDQKYMDDPTERPAPFVKGTSARVLYEEKNWILYDNDNPLAIDLNQGYIGNCFITESLKAVVRAWPHVIKSNIETISEQKGQFSVTVYDNLQTPVKIAVNLAVDKKLPNKKLHSYDRFVRTRKIFGKTIVWPLVYEKAIVKSLQIENAETRFPIIPSGQYKYDGYKKVSARGWANATLTMITGKKEAVSDVLSYANLVTALIAQNGSPIVLSSSSLLPIVEEWKNCIRPRHALAVGSIDYLNGLIEILCQFDQYVWLSFREAAIRMTKVFSVKTDNNPGDRLKDWSYQPAALTSTEWVPIPEYIKVRNDFQAPESAYDEVAFVMRICSETRRAFSMGDMLEHSPYDTVYLNTPFGYLLADDEWHNKYGQFDIYVDKKIQVYDPKKKSDEGLLPGIQFLQGRPSTCFVIYLILRKAVEKLAEVLLPPSETADKWKKLRHVMKMMMKVQGPSIKVAMLTSKYPIMPCKWPVGAFIEIIKESSFWTLLGCGSRSVIVWNRNFKKHFQVETITLAEMLI